MSSLANPDYISQAQFMQKDLSLKNIDSRIDWAWPMSTKQSVKYGEFLDDENTSCFSLRIWC